MLRLYIPGSNSNHHPFPLFPFPPSRPLLSPHWVSPLSVWSSLCRSLSLCLTYTLIPLTRTSGCARGFQVTQQTSTRRMYLSSTNCIISHFPCAGLLSATLFSNDRPTMWRIQYAFFPSFPYVFTNFVSGCDTQISLAWSGFTLHVDSHVDSLMYVLFLFFFSLYFVAWIRHQTMSTHIHRL